MNDLVLDPKKHNFLGYILFKNGQKVTLQGGAAVVFERDATQYMKNIAQRTGARFNVYFLADAKTWTCVPQNFSSFVECVPYLQSGIRVLIEYEK